MCRLACALVARYDELMDAERIKEFAVQLLDGRLSIDEFIKVVGTPATVDLGDAQVDLDRQRRCGLPEVVFAEGKTVEAIFRIISCQLEAGCNVLVTRLSSEKADVLGQRFAAGRYSEVARTFRIDTGREVTVDDRPGNVAIVSAGTSDRAVAEEAFETAQWTGAEVTLISDVGVAGPQRLQPHLAALRQVDAVIVVAGMEGALPSVVGGHLACPVIAVPTSVGYGANLGGFTALLGMLNSCASNVAVVNIDAGFKAGYIAGLIALRAAQSRAACGPTPAAMK